MASLTRADPPQRRAPIVLVRLGDAYPDAGIALAFGSPLECVVATVLSAQSTDVKVNEVTEKLFQKYRSPEDYLKVPEEELQIDIHATGFFRQKCKALRGIARVLLDEFDGEVPRSIAELLRLPGVARKTANVVQRNCFPEAALRDPDAGIAVDTHVGRIAVRLGFTRHGSKDAVKIEADLLALYPKGKSLRVTDLFIEHGRRTCSAKAPRCEDCAVESLCPSSQEAGLPDLFRAASTTMAP